jgi:hypothetical protein
MARWVPAQGGLENTAILHSVFSFQVIEYTVLAYLLYDASILCVPHGPLRAYLAARKGCEDEDGVGREGSKNCSS